MRSIAKALNVSRSNLVSKKITKEKSDDKATDQELLNQIKMLLVEWPP